VPPIKMRHTNRGFCRGEFKDQYGEACSLQKSSLATKDCIWLGISRAEVRTMQPGSGWKTWSDEELQAALGVPNSFGYLVITSRMHLTRKMVRDLLPALQHFVDTGELPEPTPRKRKQA